MKKNYFLPPLRHIALYYCFMLQYTCMAEARAGAGAEAKIRDKGGAGVKAENK